MALTYLKGNAYDPEVYPENLDHWQDGDYTVYRSTHWSAPGCHDGCGVLLYVKDGKLEKVEGDPQNDYSRGCLCMRCLDMPEAVYAKDRLKYPMKRRFEDRGKNTWERISWDECYDLIEEKTRYYQREFSPASIAVLTGTGRNSSMFQQPTLTYHAFQSPSSYGSFLSGDACYSPRGSIMALTAGCFLLSDMSQTHKDRYDSPNWRVPECILLWGNDPLRSNGDGYLGHWMVEAMKRGSELVVVDPRLNWLASKAKYWLRLRPGTDAALAMAIAGVIAEEGLIDKEFIDLWTYGYTEFAEACMQMTPEKAAEICWVDAEDIRAAARFIGNAKPMAMQWGLKCDQNVSGTPLGLTLLGIVGMTGNVDVPGGSLLSVDHAFNLGTRYWYATKDIIPGYENHILGSKRFPMRNTGKNGNMGHCDCFLESLESDGEISDLDVKIQFKMLVFYATNPITCMGAEAPRIHDALVNHTEFNIAIDLVMTPTAMACCELVIPVAMSCERNSIRAWWWPLRAIRAASDRYYDVRSDEELITSLTNRLNPNTIIPDTDIGLLDWVLEQTNVDFDFKGLVERVIVWPEWHYKKYEKGEVRYDGKPGFNTPTGRYEFTPVMLKQFGLPQVPYYEEPPESPVSRPDLAEKYPLILMTGRRSWEFFHSEHRNMATMREFHPDPLVEIAPELAEEMGLLEGDWVWIENHRGRCRERVTITPGLYPGWVMAEHAWWFPEADPENLYNNFDSNINNLTSQCTVGKSGYGSPYSGLLCKIYKCTEENSTILPTQQVLEFGGWDYERNHLA